jgi:hypothetical protein
MDEHPNRDDPWEMDFNTQIYMSDSTAAQMPLGTYPGSWEDDASSATGTDGSFETDSIGDTGSDSGFDSGVDSDFTEATTVSFDSGGSASGDWASVPADLLDGTAGTGAGHPYDGAAAAGPEYPYETYLPPELLHAPADAAPHRPPSLSEAHAQTGPTSHALDAGQTSHALATTTAQRAKAPPEAPRSQPVPLKAPRHQPGQSPKVGLAEKIGVDGEPIACPLCHRQCEGHHRLGYHWGKFGYSGPPYCSRCASVFRAHMIKRTVSADRCDRTKPCDSCSTVLNHFSCSREEAYAHMDESAASRPRRSESGEDAESTPCPYCQKMTVKRTLGLFW